MRIEKRRIVQALHITQLRDELEKLRIADDVTKISTKEREIADRIQQAVMTFPYQRDTRDPSRILTNHTINCLGASILGGALMQEAGLNYLVGEVPQHSILFLVTSDGHVEWRDMLNASGNEDLVDEEIRGTDRDGTPLTISDIVAFSQTSKPDAMRFNVISKKYRDKFSWIQEGGRQYVGLLKPEYGQVAELLNSSANVFPDPGAKIVAYRQAITLNPLDARLYFGLGNSLSNLRRFQEAIVAYQQAIAVEPDYTNVYIHLAYALKEFGRYDDAIITCRQASSYNPQDYFPYSVLGNIFIQLGRYDEAIEAYQHAISLDLEQSSLYFDLSYTFFLKGQYEKAITTIQEAINLDPTYALSYYLQGTILERINRYDEAIEAYQQYIKLLNEEVDEKKIDQVNTIIVRLKERKGNKSTT